MPRIELFTEINAPVEVVFDLSRSIDLHQISTQHTGEQAVSGRISGLIELNETVEWRAKHFGIWQHLTSKLTALEYPFYFADEMVKGAFESFKHEHHFRKKHYGTLMSDVFVYQSPLGILGKTADVLFLKRYMVNLLTTRNSTIKQYAENGQWKKLLTQAAKPQLS